MLSLPNPQSGFQVGGSLPFDALTYVQRQADQTLFDQLLQGRFCYVFNARQMGKSSLRVQTAHRLQAAGVRCGVIDITAIGTQEITPEQWYGSIAGLLTRMFQLEVNLLNWWRDRTHLSFVNRLSDFLDTVLLAQVSEPIVIFIDEIDSVLSLKFSTDDFFALIRSCYNRRAENTNYQRLTFALFGVATPSDLISDTTRTPFNIGQAIKLRGFQSAEATPLLTGLTEIIPDADVALDRILYWTGGQPFLTQKVCQLVVQCSDEFLVLNSELKDSTQPSNLRTQTLKSTPQTPIPPIQTSNLKTHTFIDALIHTHILQNWESQDEPEHLKTIRDRLLYSEQKAGRLLGLYQQVLVQTAVVDEPTDREAGDQLLQGIVADDSPEQMDLVLTGLVEKQDGMLHLKNPIYHHIFNAEWVSQQLANLRPYSQAINTWIASGYQDQSRLLRGQALSDALNWSQNKSLGDLDYRFLAASQEWDRQESQLLLEAERLKEVETRLNLERERSLEQRRNLRRQRVLLGIVSAVMMVAIALGLVAFREYQQAAINEVRAIVAASQGSLNSDQNLDALMQALLANQKFSQVKRWGVANPETLQSDIDTALQHAVLDTDEFNRLTEHQGAVLAIAISPDGQWIATASSDRTVRLWKANGTLIWSRDPGTVVYGLAFRADSQILATAGVDGDVTLWKLNGELAYPITAHETAVWHVAFSQDGKWLTTAGADGTLKLWTAEGAFVRTFTGHQSGVRRVAFSSNSQLLASASLDGTVKLWRLDGSLVTTLSGHPGGAWTVKFSPDGQYVLSGGANKTLQLWTPDGTLVHRFDGHSDDIMSADFSPDGRQIVSSSADKTIRLWRLDGSPIKILRGHTTIVREALFSPAGDVIISASDDSTVRFWRGRDVLFKRLYGQGTVKGLAFSPDSRLIASAGGKALNLWLRDGSFLKTLAYGDTEFLDVIFSPDGQTLASAGSDGTIQLWRRGGALISVLNAHDSPVTQLAFSTDGQLLVSADNQYQIKLWKRNLDNTFTLLRPLEGPPAQIWDIAFSLNGRYIASIDKDGNLWLWLVKGTAAPLFRTYVDSSGPTWGAALSSNNLTLATSGHIGEVQLWNLSGTLKQTFKSGNAGFSNFAFSLDGKIIAAASTDNTIQLLQSNGTLIASLKNHTSNVTSLAFSPDKTLLVSGGTDDSITLWDMQTISRLDWSAYACYWVRDYWRSNREARAIAPLCQSG